MNEQKGFVTRLGELIDQYHADRRQESAQTAYPQPGHLRRLLRWLTPNGGTLLLVALLILTQQVWAKPLLGPAAAPGPSATTVNYQGRLANSGGSPLTGTYGMSFALYDAATGGNLIWGPESHTAVQVSEGLFSVGLGSQTSGGIPTNVWDGDRYLQITVNGETLSPRELIRSVPIAGMALTVPDGAIKSKALNLDYGTACLSNNTQVSLSGNWEAKDVPGLSLNFSLEKPALVLVWIDGLALFNDGTAAGEADILMIVDGGEVTGSFKWTDVDWWFNVKGQRLVSLGNGSHSITVKAISSEPGTMTMHGGAGPTQPCINYLVLGEQ